MKQIIKIISILSISTVLACDINVSKSYQKDLSENIEITSKNLSSEKIYTVVDDKKADLTKIIYGQNLEIRFENIEGLKKISGKTFPGLKILIKDKKGNISFQLDDLYKDFENGFESSPLNLKAEITFATPMKSNHKYDVELTLWDKNSDGKINVKFEVGVIGNEKIKTIDKGISTSEIYLFSEKEKVVITNNKIKEHDTYFIILEKNSGFVLENELFFPGLKLEITDSDNNVLIKNEDLFNNVTESGILFKNYDEQMVIDFHAGGKDLKSPIFITALLWDKKSKNKLEIKTTCEVIKKQ